MKKLTTKDLGMTEDEMKRFESGARAAYGNYDQNAPSQNLARQPAPQKNKLKQAPTEP